MPDSLERTMKCKKAVVLLFLSLFLFTGINCYSPIGQTVTVMENFTATWLNRMPVSVAFSQLLEEHSRSEMVLIRYYVDSTADLPYPRLSCKEAEDRMKWYMKDKGLQTSFFNGTDYIKGSVPNREDETMQGRIKAYKEACEKKMYAINAKTPPVSIYATCKKNETKDDFTLEVSVKAIDKVTSSSLQLNIALVESNIAYAAINGETMHFQVFREWIKPPEITDTIGIPLSIAEFGEQFDTEFTYHLNSEQYKQDLAIVMFVQEMNTKVVLQGLEIKLN